MVISKLEESTVVQQILACECLVILQLWDYLKILFLRSRSHLISLRMANDQILWSYFCDHEPTRKICKNKVDTQICWTTVYSSYSSRIIEENIELWKSSKTRSFSSNSSSSSAKGLIPWAQYLLQWQAPQCPLWLTPWCLQLIFEAQRAISVWSHWKKKMRKWMKCREDIAHKLHSPIILCS